MTSTVTDFGEYLRSLTDDAARIAHVERLPAREAQFAELSPPLPPEVRQALADQGIDRLYIHQVAAIERLRAGDNIVVVTSTASGKTLCYNLPVLERLLDDPEAKAFYLFPTKALAQDQLRGLRRFGESAPRIKDVLACGTYDGDTPATTRRRLRNDANIILTNPDMLHQGVLPYHSRWARFFSDLRYVVVDEIHSYRGIFGSHVANVLRRLRRICDHYGARPQFICCSATIANPVELAERLIGLPVVAVDRDGSPRGPKTFLLWNPPHIDLARMERRSSHEEAKELLVALMRKHVQTIAFTKTRVAAELLFRYTQESLERRSPKLAHALRPYRAGYLPEERREIERQLFSGELMGVTSTNALELGIDVGSLDASIIVGYPGTIASTWQQAGRAGRGAEEALAVLVAYNDPIDQYLMRHPQYFFGRSPENAVVDPENAYVLASHLRCAAFELPLKVDDERYFGELTSSIAHILQDVGHVQRIDGDWYWASTDYPAAQVNLRTSSDDTFTIMDASDKNRVIGVVDAISAPELVYPGGIYLHQGDTYFVRDLDLEARAAYVEPQVVDYYTQAILDAHIRAGEAEQQRDWRGWRICHGPATVTWATTAFKKIKFYSLDSIGYGKLDLPPQHLDTVSTWLIPDAATIAEVRGHGRKFVEGLVGIRNVLVHVLPLFAMCDRTDLGGLVDSSNTGTPTIFLYDRYPGGLGFAEKGFAMVEEMMRACLALIRECECEQGCPSCVGLPVTQPPQHWDPDTSGGYPMPDKEAALVILHRLLGEEPYVPQRPQSSAGPSRASDDVPDEAVTRKIAERARKAGKRRRIGIPPPGEKASSGE
ncbi:MAG: DEAD/DEAH box helicase [Armatimonadota bacterium]|nr:MAG: DEAD/DEAH box helicase [Armatimonadota bacterium]